VIVNGHCHISEDCRRIKGVWNCFGGGSAFSGYGKEGFERRMRVFRSVVIRSSFYRAVCADLLLMCSSVYLIGGRG
jgi:hypothetical protein